MVWLDTDLGFYLLEGRLVGPDCGQRSMLMVGVRGVRRAAVFSSCVHGPGAIMSTPCVPGTKI